MEVEQARHSRFYQAFGLPLIRLMLWPLMAILGTYRVSGRYRVPQKGGLLILSNHISDADPPYLQLACPRATHFMAKSELFDMRILGRLIRCFGAFPVKRGEPDRAALRQAVSLLQEGEAVVVFPEGEASETGELLPLKPGIALIAKQAGVPVICCGIQGTDRVIPYGSLVPRPAFRAVRARWGDVRTFSKADDTELVLEWVEGQLRSLTGQEA